MIAEKQSQRKGLGEEALLLLMHYAVEFLHVERFVVKIGANNEPSLRLFREKLRFREVRRRQD